MSETLIYYLANTLLRGGTIALLLLVSELSLRRKLVFPGGRNIFILALLLILLPVGRLELSHGEGGGRLTAHGINVPDWNVELSRGVESEVPPIAKMSPSQATPVIRGPVAAIETSRRNWTLFDVLAMIYLASVLFLSAKQLRYCFLWRNRIRRCIAITGGREFDIFQKSKRLTGLERFPIQLLDGGNTLPVAACFGTLRHGAVLCPLEEYGGYTDSELQMILIHELEHLRRNDNPVAFFLTMLSNVFFINPFVRLISSRWAMIAELDCDEKVKTTLLLDRRGMAQYAGLLLASRTGGYVQVPGCGLGASAANLKLRIQEFIMNRSKFQLSCYVSGLCLLFAAGGLLVPELRADTVNPQRREPLNPRIAEKLPAETDELFYFNATTLDPQGVKLLEKATMIVANHNQGMWRLLSLMLATEKNKGCFYVANIRGNGNFVLLKNGKNPDELIISPGISDQGVTAQKLTDGYFALIPPGTELPQLGLSDRMRQQISAAPDEVLRTYRADTEQQVSIVRRDGAYVFSAILPQKLTAEWIAEKAVSYVPEAEKNATVALIGKHLKLSQKTVDGKTFSEVEFPLNADTLICWNDFNRKVKEERELADAPKVIAFSPANDAVDVDPNLRQIKVTFDRPMNPKSWSFCQRSSIDFPEVTGKPSFDESRTTVTLPVRLQPGQTYHIYLNSPPFSGFCTPKGGVLQAVDYTFSTAR